MKTLAHLYPWDVVGDPAAAERVAGLGVDGVALAASYHTVRAATPLHPEHRLVDARHAAFYLPVRADAWRGKRLVPAAPSWVAGPDSFGAAAAGLREARLPVHAWTVLTHSSRLGEANPDLTVRNAFGDWYPYALCPANDDVVEYCRTLVDEIVQCGRPEGMVLEACGPLGFTHGGHHEKTEGGDWGPVRQQLLSLCFCSGCQARLRSAGLDPDEVAARTRSAVDAGEPESVAAALGEELATALSGVRTGMIRELRQLLVGRIRELAPETRIVMHANADPWATGPSATVAPSVDADVDVFTVPGWPGPELSIPGVEAMRAVAGEDARIAAYLLALPPKPADGAALADEMRRFAEAGVAEFHLYHAGLASKRRLDAMRDAIREACS